jgi:signal transduction histidine kinase
MVVVPPLSTPQEPSQDDPREIHSLVDDELVSSNGWIISLRWLAGVGVLILSLLISPIFGLQVDLLPLSLIGASILLYNLFFFIIDHRLRKAPQPTSAYRRLAVWQVTLDWLAMTLLIHFSGGIESPAIFFFLFHILIASLFFPRHLAFAFAILAVGLISGIGLLEYFSLLPHHAVDGFLGIPLYTNPLYVSAVLLFFGSTGMIVAYLMTTISDRLRRRENEVVKLTNSLQRASARLRALNDGARTINSSLELSQVLNRFLQILAEILGVRACSIRLLDKTGKRLEPVATYGLSQAYLDKGPIELDNNPLAREVLGGKLMNIPDITQSSLLQYPEWAIQEGIMSMLSAPLKGNNKPIGILRAYSTERDHFTSDDETFLVAIAAQGSIAIENAIAYEAIKSLDADKSSFIRTVTHELRSPVSVALSLLRTITAGFAGNVNDQQLDILERATRRLVFLQKLVDDLLDLAAGKVTILHEETVPVSLEDVIQKVIKRFAVPAQEKGLTLEFVDQTSGLPVIVQASLEGLDRIFNNLISNAIKYTLPNGRVTITLTRNDKDVHTVVEDTGIGISEEAMEHMFEEFYRAPNAKEIDREGTGLGLTIVKDTIHRFGGTIQVHSQLGVGTRFTVLLPLVPNH